MKHIRLAVMVSLVFAIITGTGLAGVRGKLVGLVSDTKGEPIGGATILLTNPEIEGQQYSTTTKDNGHYAFAGLEPVFYIVDVTAEGYVGRRNNIKIRAGIKIDQDFELLTPEEVRALTPLTPQEMARDSFNAGIDLYQNKQFDKALEKLQEALGYNADLHQAHMAMGDIYYQQNKYDEALASFDKALASGEEYPDAYLMQGNVYNNKKMRKEAIAAWSKYVEHKQDPVVQYNIGALYSAEKDYDGAMKAFLKTTEIQPDYPEPYKQLGYLYLKQANHAESKKAFNKYLELKPDAADAKEIKELISIFP
ncbi:tetratricopeptide repeat protein [bacterium]|nr:tetratricopeptide repeat protein [candidate division CSSED10-310 bacterium]